MTSCLSDMRTVRPQGLTFRITQLYGLRSTKPSQGRNRLIPRYDGVFTSRLRHNDLTNMQWKMTIGWFLIHEYYPLIIGLSCGIVSPSVTDNRNRETVIPISLMARLG
jgi:hypothetical protein